jgi:DNA-binding MarR family transcriptional regulator
MSKAPVSEKSSPLDRLDQLLQHRSRFGTMVLLSGVDALSFTNLRETLGETDGNLGAQLRKLEEADYLVVRKEFNDRKPISWYSISAKGRSALKSHVQAMESLIKSAKL